MDKILIHQLKVTGIIGIYDHERSTPQEFVIDIVLFTDTRKAGKSDDFADCLDYESICNDVLTLAQTAKRQTVEAMAEDIATLCLGRKGVKKARVRVIKTQAISFTSGVGVEITRTR